MQKMKSSVKLRMPSQSILVEDGGHFFGGLFAAHTPAKVPTQSLRDTGGGGGGPTRVFALCLPTRMPTLARLFATLSLCRVIHCPLADCELFDRDSDMHFGSSCSKIAAFLA